MSAGSILLRNHFLSTGRFLDVLPDSVLRYNAKQWSLKALPVDLGVEPRSIAIVTLKNRSVSPVVQLFVEHLRAIAKVDVCDIGSDWHNRRKRKWGCIMQPLEGLARPEGLTIYGSRPGNRA